MTYTKQTWQDGEAGGTPLSAARLNHMEDGIADAHTASGVRLLRTSDLSVNDTSLTTISWSSEERDDDGYWDSGNSGIITIPEDAWYDLLCQVRWDTASTGSYRDLYILVDGIAVGHTQVRLPPVAAMRQQAALLEYLTAGTEVSFAVQQDSGATRSLVATSNQIWAALVRR